MDNSVAPISFDVHLILFIVMNCELSIIIAVLHILVVDRCAAVISSWTNWRLVPGMNLLRSLEYRKWEQVRNRVWALLRNSAECLRQGRFPYRQYPFIQFFQFDLLDFMTRVVRIRHSYDYRTTPSNTQKDDATVPALCKFNEADTSRPVENFCWSPIRERRYRRSSCMNED